LSHKRYSVKFGNSGKSFAPSKELLAPTYGDKHYASGAHLIFWSKRFSIKRLSACYTHVLLYFEI